MLAIKEIEKAKIADLQGHNRSAECECDCYKLNIKCIDAAQSSFLTEFLTEM